MPVSLHQQAALVSVWLHHTSKRVFHSSQKIQNPPSRSLSKHPQVCCLHPSRCLKTRLCQWHSITTKQSEDSMAAMHWFDTCQKRTRCMRPCPDRCLVETRWPSRFATIRETMHPSLILWCSMGHSQAYQLLGWSGQGGRGPKEASEFIKRPEMLLRVPWPRTLSSKKTGCNQKPT